MIETIYAPASLDGGEGVLATVIRAGYSPLPSAAKFFSAPDEALQVGVVTKRAGLSVGAHAHPPKPRQAPRSGPLPPAAVEVLVVRSGTVKVVVYTSAFEPAGEVTLGAGDAVVFRAGGHAVTAITDYELLEVKEGPYLGAEDKRFANESRP